MKLWRLFRPGIDGFDYDEFDAAIVAAETEDDARTIQPSNRTDLGSGVPEKYVGWVPPDQVSIEYIGEAKPGTKRGVILASFNAG